MLFLFIFNMFVGMGMDIDIDIDRQRQDRPWSWTDRRFDMPKCQIFTELCQSDTTIKSGIFWSSAGWRHWIPECRCRRQFTQSRCPAMSLSNRSRFRPFQFMYYIQSICTVQCVLKGTVRRDLRGVKSGINRQVLILGFTAIDFFLILKGHRPLKFEKLLNVREWQSNWRFFKNVIVQERPLHRTVPYRYSCLAGNGFTAKRFSVKLLIRWHWLHFIMFICLWPLPLLISSGLSILR